MGSFHGGICNEVLLRRLVQICEEQQMVFRAWLTSSALTLLVVTTAPPNSILYMCRYVRNCHVEIINITYSYG